jgi:hypothetical protein
VSTAVAGFSSQQPYGSELAMERARAWSCLDLGWCGRGIAVLTTQALVEPSAAALVLVDGRRALGAAHRSPHSVRALITGWRSSPLRMSTYSRVSWLPLSGRVRMIPASTNLSRRVDKMLGAMPSLALELWLFSSGWAGRATVEIAVCNRAITENPTVRRSAARHWRTNLDRQK